MIFLLGLQTLKAYEIIFWNILYIFIFGEKNSFKSFILKQNCSIINWFGIEFLTYFKWYDILSFISVLLTKFKKHKNKYFWFVYRNIYGRESFLLY